MRELVTIAKRARGSFEGRLGVQAVLVIGMATLTGATAGVLPAVVGRAVAVVAGGKAPSQPGSGGAILVRLIPEGSSWAALGFALVATIVTVGIGVWSSKLGTSLSGDLTSALRIELMRAVLGASPRAVEEAAASAHETPEKSKRPPSIKPSVKDTGATRDAAVRLAISREAALVGDFAVSVGTSLPQSLTTLLVLGVQLVMSDAWIVLVGGAALFGLSRLAADRASRRAARVRGELQRADAEVFGQVQETVTAAEDLRLWGAREQAVEEFARAARGAAHARARFAAALAVSGQIRSVFTAMAPLLIVLALQISGGTHGAGDVAKLLLLVPLLMTRLEALDAMRQGLIERDPVVRATARLLDLPPHPPPALEPVRLNDVKGNIAFEDVTYTPPGANAPVLDGISFEVPPGAIVGICGPSGSGKSMLLRLLLRMDDPDRGRIVVDGTELTKIDPEELPHLFGVVRQTSQLLQRPLRDNLGIGLDPIPDDETMRLAIAKVHLDRLDGRTLDTAYRANPPNLSGGECRRVLLARMLLGKTRVCVLDEPEAGLPGATAESILRTVVEQAEGRTHLVVTHAPHLLESDFNLVLDKGKLVAKGTHAELVDSCALYRELLAEALRD